MPEGVVLRRGHQEDRDALVAMQEAAYAPNRQIIGGTPAPLTWDYRQVLADYEVWLAHLANELSGALILEARATDLYIQSISVAPHAKGRGIGNQLLAHAETRAIERRLGSLRLTANALMVFNVDWYVRKGFMVETVETTGERRRIHMAKSLTGP